MSINVKELKIGNYFSDNDGELILKVSLHELNERTLDYKFFGEPIPLSKDLILKCKGFTQVGEYLQSFDGIFEFDEKLNHIWDGAYTSSPCDYLHQFQNLYSSLYGLELEFKQQIQ